MQFKTSLYLLLLNRIVSSSFSISNSSNLTIVYIYLTFKFSPTPSYEFSLVPSYKTLLSLWHNTIHFSKNSLFVYLLKHLWNTFVHFQSHVFIIILLLLLLSTHLCDYSTCSPHLSVVAAPRHCTCQSTNQRCRAMCQIHRYLHW